MTKYVIMNEDKPVKLKKQNTINDRRLVTCPNCNNKTNLPGRNYRLASCTTCRWVFYNPDYDN